MGKLKEEPGLIKILRDIFRAQSQGGAYLEREGQFEFFEPSSLGPIWVFDRRHSPRGHATEDHEMIMTMAMTTVAEAATRRWIHYRNETCASCPTRSITLSFGGFRRCSSSTSTWGHKWCDSSRFTPGEPQQRQMRCIRTNLYQLIGRRATMIIMNISLLAKGCKTSPMHLSPKVYR